MIDSIDKCMASLASYDCDAYGPLFAVSDEGSAAETVVEAAHASAKARALRPLDLTRLGFALDGERMTSAGEVPIGPEEYCALNAAAAGRLFCTTNVGVRVNARLNQQLPEFDIPDNSATGADWVGKVVETFTPFLNTPDGRPRPLTIRLRFEPDRSPESLIGAVELLEAARREGKIGPETLHRLTGLVVFEREISSENDFGAIETAIEIAARAGLKELAIDGELRQAARLRLEVQSLLNILDVDPLRRLLAVAQRIGVRLAYRYQIDVESAARTIWTGLLAARANGFSAGKYGLVPLTFEEQALVIELITRWTAGWTAIPAFYVDTPLLTESDVYDDSRCEKAATIWLKMARGAGAKIVLFDCPDRVTPRRLVRDSDTSNGVLSYEAIDRILTYARELGVAVLWSGGITAGQAFELARRRVFGIFSTSSTAAKIAVTAQFERDPRLPSEKEPTEFGVRRMHSIIQGGFLSNVLSDYDGALAISIETKTFDVINANQDPSLASEALAGLDAELVRGWRSLHPIGNNNQDTAAASFAPAADPVPADAVRVFRGRKRSSLSRPDFLAKLATVFMPLTVQMQRLYGLTAYIPAVPPPNDNAMLPDELALVFYRTQGAYHEAKRAIGGRTYSDAHDLVFDVKASGSGFPELFDDNLEFDRPYHLFVKSTDWQTGAARLYFGERLPAVSAEDFALGVTKIAESLRQSPGALDGVIFCAGRDWIAWWEHAPEAFEDERRFEHLCKTVFASAARRLRIPPALTQPYSGLSLNARGDFLNFQFPRV